MKSKEELSALKEEVETLNRKLHELTDEELEQVSGGLVPRDVASRAAREFCDKLPGDLAADPGLHRTLLGDAFKIRRGGVAGVYTIDDTIPPAPKAVPQIEVTFDIDNGQ